MTYAYIAIAAATAISAMSSVRQGQAQEAMANYQADQEKENAKQVAQITSTQEDEQRAKARQIIGSQIAAGAESGTQLNGSAADLLRQSLFNAESDAMQIRYEGNNRATGFLNQAKASQASGKSAKSAGYLSAAGALARGASSAYGGKQGG